MDNIERKKLNRLLKIKEEIKPKTFLDDLAESGWMDIYLNNYSKKKLEEDIEFKEKVYESLYNYSQTINNDVEFFFLDKLCESLAYFLEYTKECQKQMP
jgi:hypothetical protein